MIAEFGQLALIIAFFFAISLIIIPYLGLKYDKKSWISAADYFVFAQFIFVVIGYIALTVCFLTNDFSLLYVVNNSSTNLPWFYKLCAVWGGHEGSILLWILILSFWMLLVTCFSGPLPRLIKVRVQVVLGAISVGFLMFLLATSNPFWRQFELLDTTGRDLNPLLQDPGFLFHPPMLYMGYVGFSVAFAYAIAALWAKKIEKSWTAWTRPWTLLAWCCLTLGITLGSWWAYRELGWGGFWFWDPVENASFMPWLAGTALIHSLAVSSKRQNFKAWSLLLAICAFSLSLIGTFLVRSGVLTSVHAFAVDPTRGLYILLFLFLVIGGSLTLFAFNAPDVKDNQQTYLISREGFLLVNNVLLIVAMLTILMGTLYPLIIDGLHLGKLSVGAPYFNQIFIKLAIPLFFLMGFGIHLKWQQDKLLRMIYPLTCIFILSILVAISVLYWLRTFNWIGFIGFMAAFWIILSTFLSFIYQIKKVGVTGVHQSYLGMTLAHLGVAISIFGIAGSTQFGESLEIELKPSEHVFIKQYDIEFVSEKTLSGPNYESYVTTFKIQDKAHRVFYIHPEKRIYNISRLAMSEAAIHASFARDIYIALGEPLDDNRWTLRVYYKPFVRCIWGGGLFMCLGGVISMMNRRFFYSKVKPYE